MNARSLRNIVLVWGILVLCLSPMVQSAMSESIPAGVIVMWSGSLNDIPPGWTLCDGTNETPDLRDKFIYGATNDAEIGATSGSTTHSHTYTEVPLHSHSAICRRSGSHYHRYELRWHRLKVAKGNYDRAASALTTTQMTTMDGDHFHSITVNNAGQATCSTQTANSLPPYYKLAFIMKLPRIPGCLGISVVSSFGFPGKGTPHGLAFDGNNLCVVDRDERIIHMTGRILPKTVPEFLR